MALKWKLRVWMFVRARANGTEKGKEIDDAWFIFGVLYAPQNSRRCSFFIIIV
jgi:hypothetical protein